MPRYMHKAIGHYVVTKDSANVVGIDYEGNFVHGHHYQNEEDALKAYRNLKTVRDIESYQRI